MSKSASLHKKSIEDKGVEISKEYKKTGLNAENQKNDEK